MFNSYGSVTSLSLYESLGFKPQFGTSLLSPLSSDSFSQLPCSFDNESLREFWLWQWRLELASVLISLTNLFYLRHPINLFDSIWVGLCFLVSLSNWHLVNLRSIVCLTQWTSVARCWNEKPLLQDIHYSLCIDVYFVEYLALFAYEVKLVYSRSLCFEGPWALSYLKYNVVFGTSTYMYNVNRYSQQQFHWLLCIVVSWHNEQILWF